MTHTIRITQAELAEISELERELPSKVQHLKDMRSNLLALLRGGVEIEPGRFDAKLITCIGRAVPWKQVYIELFGDDEATALKRKYKTHTYYDVKVLEHAIRPSWNDNADEDEEGSDS